MAANAAKKAAPAPDLASQLAAAMAALEALRTQLAKPEPEAAPAGDAKLAYRLDEIIAQSIVGKTKLFELIRTRQLAARKIGSVTFILAEDWHAFLRSRPLGPGPARHKPTPKGRPGEAAVPARRKGKARGRGKA